MKLANFSARSIISVILGLAGVLALALALISGSIHRDLVFENQQKLTKELLDVSVNERLKDLYENTRDLALTLQNPRKFKNAFKEKDINTLKNILDNQFHQYFVTSNIIKLEQLAIFDTELTLITESNEGNVFFSGHEQTICPKLYKQAILRKGHERIKLLSSLCHYGQQPIYAVLVPIGGLRLLGYIMVITDPSHNLFAMESALGMPLKFVSINNSLIYQSAAWPTNETVSLISTFNLKASDGFNILSIQSAQDITPLTESLQTARFEVFAILSIGTMLLILVGILILRKTMLNPLKKLAARLSNLHSDKARIGDQMELTGTREIYEITNGFNTMSKKLRNLYGSLEVMAYTDPLTKLPNRNQFQASLENSIQQYNLSKIPFALFLIDLDRFKGVNDTLGHHVGDALLKEVSFRLQSILRSDDLVYQLDKSTVSELDENLVARLGGDEFSAILTGINTIDDSIAIAKKLVLAMEKAFLVNEHKLTIGLSIGIAIYPEHGKNINELVSHADIAMYDAKNRKCGYSLYHSAQNQNSLHTLKLEQDLFASIKNEELLLYYQPKISIHDERVYGVEALIRWNHPTQGLIPPDNFIPIAEQTGFIQPLTEWVLNKALQDCSTTLNRANQLNFSVNLSALNLRDDRISEVIVSMLEKWSVPPELLTLELTESSIMDDPDFAINILNELDAKGVCLAIDDFGTGHSSLAYIKNLPLDELKIDKSFIFNITDDVSNQAIIKAVLVLAEHIHLSIVAEGVEDKETLDMLKQFGCHIAQGYYFAKPMPFDECMDWIKNH